MATPLGGFPHKEHRELVAAALKAGWRMRRIGDHIQLLSPDGVHIVTAGLTESRAGFASTRARMRRYGFKC